MYERAQIYFNQGQELYTLAQTYSTEVGYSRGVRNTMKKARKFFREALKESDYRWENHERCKLYVGEISRLLKSQPVNS
jgi:hypothetical protein